MNYKPILIVIGEPYSVFSELIFKLFKHKKFKNKKNKIVLIGSKKLLHIQMKKLKFKFSFNIINHKQFSNSRLSKNSINLIDINFKFKKPFSKISDQSNEFIHKTFDVALKLLKENFSNCLINGPVSKKHFLKKKFLGITEYLQKKTKIKNETTMIIYNEKLSVSPLTTHLPLKQVAKKISIKKIVYSSKQINNFYTSKIQKKPKIAILGLNPHCETVDKFSEEDKIIKPAIKILKKKNIYVSGPFPADTFFLKKNIEKFDIVIGMYHDQVLTPIKTLFNFNAINITLGLPFIRISPDHGPNNQMIGKNKSNIDSILFAMSFLNKINAI